MRNLAIIFCIVAQPLFGVAFDGLKEEIAKCESLLEQNPTDAQLHYKLARSYFYDQEIDASFKHFLYALDYSEPKEPSSFDSCQDALDFYLSQSGADPIAVATNMLKRYNEKNSKELGFILSIAYANIGDYDSFFSLFFEGYPHLCDSFLAHKTRGILSLRVMQGERDPKTLAQYREKALHHLTLALEQNKCDAALYKVLIFLAKDEKNDVLVSNYLHKMVENQVQVARADIYLYVREAIALDESVLAKQILDQAKKYYEYSRAITAAEEYLNQHVK